MWGIHLPAQPKAGRGLFHSTFICPQASGRARSCGFSLIELLLALVVISILAVVALPSYHDYVQRSRIVDATSTLTALAVRMEQNFLDTRSYAATGGNANECAFSQNSNENFSFSCATDGQTYTWLASSRDGLFRYSLNQNGDKSTLLFDGQQPPANQCWMLSQNGECLQ